jgi:hypothetical protein
MSRLIGAITEALHRSFLPSWLIVPEWDKDKSQGLEISDRDGKEEHDAG